MIFSKLRLCKCIASALQMHNGNALKIRHLRKNPAKTPRKSPIIRKLMKTNPHLIFPAKCKSNTAFSLIVTALCVIPLVFSPFLATLYPTHNSKTIMDDDYFPVLKSPELLGHQFFPCAINATGRGVSRAHNATFSRFFLQNCSILPTFAMLTVDRAIILFRRAIGQFAHIRASYCPTEDNGGCRIRKIKSKFPAEWRLSSVSSVYGGRFLYSPNYQSFNAYR